MRFMILRRADAKTEAGILPTGDLLAAMGDYIEQLNGAGVLLDGDGLRPSSRGVRVKFSGGKPSVVDGPFTETKELIAGYVVLQVKSLEEAVEWARRWPALDGDGEVELEIRPFHEADDFGDSFDPELREREERMRAEAAQRR
ncbi:MAG TPA: YciI family protein [Candidatus Dormibacteraeota bacterium]|jgi:hypothetical protein|nr:YciI family protein [Candidatus Dormibacteraeota bacterium]